MDEQQPVVAYFRPPPYSGNSRNTRISPQVIAADRYKDNIAEPPSMAIRVLLADAREIYRTGLHAVLGSDPRLTVVGVASEVSSALVLAREHKPDVVVVADDLPPENGLRLIERMRPYGVNFILLVDAGDAEAAVAALRAGARGYLLRHRPPQTVIEAVLAMTRGEAMLDSSVALQVVQQLDNLRTPSIQRAMTLSSDFDNLTRRQREVVSLVADGLSNAEIAAALCLSQATVKSHLRCVLRALSLRDRTQLAVFVHRAARQLE
jgi:DNA-binding NarL/FixJ family response regulator